MISNTGKLYWGIDVSSPGIQGIDVTRTLRNRYLFGTFVIYYNKLHAEVWRIVTHSVCENSNALREKKTKKQLLHPIQPLTQTVNIYHESFHQPFLSL